MCDCYTAKCEGCSCSMEIHISDYCTKRKNVHPYCNRCTRKLVKPVAVQIFEDVIDDFKQVEGIKSKHIRQNVIILCDDAEAYGIHLN